MRTISYYNMRILAFLSKDIFNYPSTKPLCLARKFSSSISSQQISLPSSIQQEKLLKPQFTQSFHYQPKPLTLSQIQSLLDQYPIINQIPADFFESIEQNIHESLKNYNKDTDTKILSKILTIYLKLGQKNLSFLEPAQKIIFQNLSQLNFKDAHILYTLCVGQRNLGIQDMIDYVQKPYLKEIVERFDKTDILSISVALAQYANNREFYGIYVSNDIKEKVFQGLSGSRNLNLGNSFNKIKTYYNLLYFAYISGILNENIAMQACNNLIQTLYFFTLEDFLKFGAIFSSFNTIPIKFWMSFFSCTINLHSYSSTSLKYLFVLIMTRLKVSEPRIQTQIFKSLNFEVQEWLLNFKGNKKIKINSENNEETDFIIELLKSKKLDVVLNLDDGVLIDFAVPNKRLAYLLCDPGKSIWPEGTPDGEFSDRCFILTKKHWKVRIIYPHPKSSFKDRLYGLIKQDLST